MPRDNLPAANADNINEAHRKARSSAETAVQYAIQCGKLLTRLKDSLPRGEFDAYIKDYFDFGRATAYNYMKHSKSSNALDGSAVRHLFPSGRKPKPAPRTFPPHTPKGAVSVVNPKGTEETGKDRPAAPIYEPDIEAWEPEEDEEAHLEQAEKEYAASIDKVMAADDKLAAAHAEIKRQAAEIASLKISRDGFQTRCDVLVKSIKSLQRENAKLKRRAA